MGLFNLYRFCFAFAFISLVVSPSFAQNRWSVAKPSITTEYYVLDEKTIPMRPAPTGRDVMVINKANTGNSSFSVPRGGEQTIQQRGTIEAVNKSTTLKGRFKWSSFQVKNGLKTAWKVGKITPVSILGAFVLDTAIDKGKEWYTGDDGKLYFKGSDKVYLDSVDGDSSCWSVVDKACYSDPAQACSNINFPPSGTLRENFTGSMRIKGEPNANGSFPFGDGLECEYFRTTSPDRKSWGRASTLLKNMNSCPSGYSQDQFGCFTSSSGGLVPDDEIFALMDEIEPEEYSPLQFEELIKTAELDKPYDFVITGIDPVQGDVSETVITDEITGDEIIIKDSNSYDFDIKNSNGNPTVTGSTTNKKDTYTNGSLTGSSNTTNVAPPFVGDNPAPDTGDIKVELDIEECRDFPESCAYYDYMKEDFVPPDNVDYGFSEIDMGEIDLSSSFQYDFDLGVEAVCPLPYVLDLDMFGVVEVSFQPLCDVADSARPFVITSSIIASLLMLLGVSRKL